MSGALVAGCSESSTTAPTADRGQPTPARPAAREALDDSSIITASVKTRLAMDKVPNVTKITVDTRGGVVTLSGEVEDRTTRERAIEGARSVAGVRDVVDNLTTR